MQRFLFKEFSIYQQKKGAFQYGIQDMCIKDYFDCNRENFAYLQRYSKLDHFCLRIYKEEKCF